MQAVILAGGRGKRLHPLTSKTPKSMVDLFDKPALEHTIELLKRHEIRDIVVTLHYKAEQIINYFGGGSKWGVNIQYSLEDIPKGTAGGLRRIQPVLNRTFLAIAGDAVTDFDLTSAVEFHRKRSAIATILLYEADDPSQFGIVQAAKDGKITRFFQKPRASEVVTNMADTGIYVLEPEVLSSIPYDAVYDLGRDLFPRLLQNEEPFYACRTEGYWCDMSNLAQYRNVHFDALTGKVNLNLPGSEIADGVWLGRDAEIHPSLKLMSPVYLGSGVRIEKDVSVGRFAVIGDMSVVGQKARITHSVLGSRTIVGKNARVYGSLVGTGCKLSDGRELADEIILHDGSDTGLRAEINSEHLMPMATTEQTIAWSGLELLRLAHQESAQQLAA